MEIDDTSIVWKGFVILVVFTMCFPAIILAIDMLRNSWNNKRKTKPK